MYAVFIPVIGLDRHYNTGLTDTGLIGHLFIGRDTFGLSATGDPPVYWGTVV